MEKLFKNVAINKKLVINDINNIGKINNSIDKVYIIISNNNNVKKKYIEILMKKLNINYLEISIDEDKTDYKKIDDHFINFNFIYRSVTINKLNKYLTYIWCLNDIVENNYKNSIILYDNIFISKQSNNIINNLLDNLILDYDYLILGYQSYIDSKKNFLHRNIYLLDKDKTDNINAIYCSNNAAKKIFNNAVKKIHVNQKIKVDIKLYIKLDIKLDINNINNLNNINHLLKLFDNKRIGIIYPELFIYSENILKNDTISDLKKISDYYYLDFDLINVSKLLDISLYKNYRTNDFIIILLENFFGKNIEKVKYYFELFKSNHDFLNTEDYLQLIDNSLDKWDREFYKYVDKYCKSSNINSAELIKNPIEYNKYLERYWNQNYKNFSCPVLFHKQLLNITNKRKIHYEIKVESKISRLNICHLHCFDIDRFDEFYGEYYKKILEYMDIIVTYCIGDNIQNLGITILKINNYGYDIGAKFSFMSYLNRLNIEYKYILFLQSKSAINIRKYLYRSLIYNLHLLKDLDALEASKCGGFFPPQICSGGNSQIIYNDICDFDIKRERQFRDILRQKYHSNIEYIDDFERYLKISESIKMVTVYPYGNMYILHNKIANILFSDIEIYKCLNDKDSFDYGWVKKQYNINYNNVNFVYHCFKKFGLINNNLKMREIEKKYVLSDFMVEHIYERIIFKIIKNFGMDIKILHNINNNNKDKNTNNINIFSQKLNKYFFSKIK